jgi:hypothetical protein
MLVLSVEEFHLEYLHLGPTSRRRRCKKNPVWEWGLTEPLCPLGKQIQGPGPSSWGLVAGLNTLLYKIINRPPLWSSGQSSWLQIRRPGFDSRHYQKQKVVGLERGPFSLVSTTEELLDRKVAAPV